MNEFDGLRPDDNALRYFFSRDTLYVANAEMVAAPAEELSTNSESNNQNPAILKFEGEFSADFLMIFRHNEKTVLAGAWGEMIGRLIENPSALNLKKSEVVFCNSLENPSLSTSELALSFPAKNVLVWGTTEEPSIDARPVYAQWMEGDKRILKVHAPEHYIEQPKSRVELLNEIKTKLI